MKKFVAILLTLMLVLGMTAAVAEETTTYTDQETVTIYKSYRNVNTAGASPAETFTLEQDGDGTVTDGEAKGTIAPALGAITGATYAYMGATGEGAKAAITVALPSYDKVGVYEYHLKEVAGDTAGVTYYTGDIKLVVTVINGDDGKLRIAAVHTATADGTKSDTFENTYSAGILAIEKKVEGNLGDKQKDFSFTVTFTAPEGKTWEMKHDGEYMSINAAANQYGTVQASTPTIGEKTITYTLTLKDGGRVAFGNLPYGVTYTVTEADYSGEGYTTDKTGDTGTIDAANKEALFTNTKNGEIDTGVTTESLPYVVLMGFVVLAGAALLLKRKAHNN